MAGVMALLFITAIFITFKIFRVHKLREAEKYHNPKFLKHLQNIDEFLSQTDGFDGYITWKNRDEILKKYEKLITSFKENLSIIKRSRVFANLTVFMKTLPSSLKITTRDMSPHRNNSTASSFAILKASRWTISSSKRSLPMSIPA